jgi:hypothetical protein
MADSADDVIGRFSRDLRAFAHNIIISAGIVPVRSADSRILHIPLHHAGRFAT